jgi:hypothetical protein
MIYIPSFMTIRSDIQAILRFCLSNSRGCNFGIINWRGFLFKSVVEMAYGGMICLPNFMMIVSSIQVIFRLLP